MATEHNSLVGSLSSAMNRLMQDTDLADLTVICGDKQWKVHSNILAVRSPFFQAAITTNMVEKREMKIEIKEFNPEAMDYVIKFMYGVPNEKAPLKFLFEAAERFQMDDLKNYVVELSKKEMTVANVIELGHLAEMYNIEAFLKDCAKFVVNNDVPLKEQIMSPMLATMVVSMLKETNQKFKERFQRECYCWSEDKWSNLYGVRLDGQNLLEYAGCGVRDVGVALAKVPLSKSNYYFEIEIINPGSKCAISIGLANKDYAKGRHPGWNVGSIGYHADDGNVYNGSGKGDRFGPICGKGDIMGCGIMFPHETDSGEDGEYGEKVKVQVYFTKNGKFIGMKVATLCREEFFPTIGMMSTKEKVRVNLNPDCKQVSVE